MEKQEKIEILSKYFGSPMRHGEEFLFYCPVCKHPKKKLSVNFEKNKFKCWVCHYSGNTIKKLIFEHIGDNVDWEDAKLQISLEAFESVIKNTFSNQKIETIIEDVFPSGFIPLTSKEDIKLKDKALEYLYGRSITREDIIKWRMGFDNNDDLYGRIIIPSFDTDGKCNFFVARSFIHSKYKYWTAQTHKKEIIFNEIDIDWTKSITLVEGVFDAIVAGPNAIPLLGSSLEKGNRIFSKILEYKPIVYLALDNEKEAIKASMKIAEMLHSQMVDVYIIDIGGYKDPGSMTKDEFQKRKQNAIKFNFYNFFKKLLISEE